MTLWTVEQAARYRRQSKEWKAEQKAKSEKAEVATGRLPPFAEETSGDTDAKLFPQLRSDFCQGSSTAELFAAAADHL